MYNYSILIGFLIMHRWKTCEKEPWQCASPQPTSCIQQSWVVCGKFYFTTLSPPTWTETWLKSNAFNTSMRFTIARMFGQEADSVRIEAGKIANPEL